ncbi:MAG: extracellular solute-binding protein [Treponema sp.]|jgi:ABC-type glycerol-3-phosphate transport system substrate-binding protein|nr:extracellular solute-binding protein [Treponema sp.]
MKKSISSAARIDIFIILAAVVLITCLFIFSINFKTDKKAETEFLPVELLISPRCEELFGVEMTGTLMWDFEEQNPELILRLLQDEDKKEADIFIFDQGELNLFLANGIELHSAAEPLVSFINLLFYNIGLLEAADFDRPPKTREEFLAFARAVSAGGTARSMNAAGAAISLSPRDRQAVSRDIFSWIWAAGNNMWNPDSDTPVINTRALIRDISFLGDLNRAGAFAPAHFDMTGDQLLEEFAKGKIAMMIASSGAIPYLREKMGDDAFGITNIPGSGTGGKYSGVLSGIYAGVNANCRYPDEALRFLEFLAEKSLILCTELKAVPGVTSDLFAVNYMNTDPFYSKARDIYESTDIIQGFSGKTGAVQYENIVRDEMRVFFDTSRSAQDTANAIQRRWDLIR